MKIKDNSKQKSGTQFYDGAIKNVKGEYEIDKGLAYFEGLGTAFFGSAGIYCAINGDLKQTLLAGCLGLITGYLGFDANKRAKSTQKRLKQLQAQAEKLEKIVAE